MKYIILLILFLCLYKINAQESTASVEQSVFGVQTGLLGVWAHNEAKLSNTIALRSEVGLDAGFGGSENDLEFVLVPVLRLEPRWYHSLKRRAEKGRNTAKNSANFLGLGVWYYPDLFVISGFEQVDISNSLVIVPKYGLKRTYWEHFTLEAGGGVGYFRIFNGETADDFNSGVAIDLHLRIGYTF